MITSHEVPPPRQGLVTSFHASALSPESASSLGKKLGAETPTHPTSWQGGQIGTTFSGQNLFQRNKSKVMSSPSLKVS